MKKLAVVLGILLMAGCLMAAELSPKDFIGKDTTSLILYAGSPDSFGESGKYTIWIYRCKIGHIKFFADNYIIFYYEIVTKNDSGEAVVVERYKK